MKITLEVEDKEKTLDAINNGIAALSTIYPHFAYWVLDGLNHKWHEWWEAHNEDYDECAKLIADRMAILKDLFEQIENQ